MRITQEGPATAIPQAGVRLRTLVVLRWMAVAGQLAALLTVGLWLGYPLPWGPTLLPIGLLAALNLALTLVYPPRTRIGGGAALLQLAIDLFELAILLFLTGGLANPFSVLLLLPVTIGATLLSARQTLALLGTALLVLVGLWLWHLPLPWADSELVVLPTVYRVSVFVATGLGLLFVTFYTWQISAEARRRQRALVATEAALERETRMGALGSLAAAAAHELGGPLGTILLIARDLQHALSGNEALADDVRLLNHEANRARDILFGISERAEAEQPFPEVQLSTLARELLAQFEPTRVAVATSFHWEKGKGPLVPRIPELLHGIHNLMSNALRHAKSRVEVDAGERAGEKDGGLWLAIADDGPGFSADLMPKLGEPFLGPSRSGSGSTGLGIFIATTLLERVGGHLRFENRPEGGARVLWEWPQPAIEATRRRMNHETREEDPS